MTQLDGSLGETSNEFHYAYDQAGRLRHAAFAQTPQSHMTGWPYYTGQDPAQTRAHTLYSYDGAGRSTGVETYFQTWNPTLADYEGQSKIAQGYLYDERGLRSSQQFLSGVPGGPEWSTLRTETYTYEPQRGYLTSVNYGDGSPVSTWTYDLAGNRASWNLSVGPYLYDNLNRFTYHPNTTYTNDLLGNRTWENYGLPGGKRYVYDELSRATSICGETDGAAYEYRADGMRVEKVSGLTITWNPADKTHRSGWYDQNWSVNKATTRYFYDGQMCMEEDFMPEAGGNGEPSVTRYGLGARGIDMIERTTAQGATRAYPLYDGHGNMLATISLSGALANQRHYDVWGAVRAEQDVDAVNPRGQYVANLGHQTDVESNLIYMRARYYDPGTARFVTEDPARDGVNWFVYCNNDPVNTVDADGRAWDTFEALWRSIAPLLSSFGLRGMLGIGTKFGARMLGKALVAVGFVLARVGYGMASYARILAQSENFFARIGGAVLGRLRAKAVAASLSIRSVGYFMEAFGSDVPFGPTKGWREIDFDDWIFPN
ncbi:MAG: RHS repeat-associated core domain-containing protein [Fimbriimonadaceae bacterium]|nr:RHS repeat-associated core domain-containing protein [Chthonomonadaceae bacterium]MCO5296910.1 RHS repeat-associated core domain-containing protein [Fimbriimonadaceae bacterium]